MTIIGDSKAIRRVLQQVSKVAESDSTVLLLGETGTGKELFAEAIHRHSQRSSRRMIKFNCAAVPCGLLESELFGHERGAFTGADNLSKGRFELAHGSSLMLDEIADMPLSLQPKLLRILQTREVERLGGHKIIPVDVRLIAATNRNLKAMVQNGIFRDDLFYRLNVFPIIIPPLRDRREDIPLLTHHFIRQFSQQQKKDIRNIPQATMRWLCDQSWPGNVRELSNVIERAVILTEGTTLFFDHESEPSYCPGRGLRPAAAAQGLKKGGQDEQEAIEAAIIACNGVISGPRGMAVMLGIKRTTLAYRIQRLGLDIDKILQQSRRR